MSKQALYKSLIERQRAADDAGFYLESVWLAYAILEDRTSSMLRSLGIPPADSFFEKTLALAWRAGEKDGGLSVYFQGDKLVASEPEGKAVAKDRGRGSKKKMIGKTEDEKTAALAQVNKFPALKGLSEFRLGRNNLTHAMAEGTIDAPRLDATAQSLSADGVRLVKTFATLARRIKAHAKGTKKALEGRPSL